MDVFIFWLLLQINWEHELLPTAVLGRFGLQNKRLGNRKVSWTTKVNRECKVINHIEPYSMETGYLAQLANTGQHAPSTLVGNRGIHWVHDNSKTALVPGLQASWEAWHYHTWRSLLKAVTRTLVCLGQWNLHTLPAPSHHPTSPPPFLTGDLLTWKAPLKPQSCFQFFHSRKY